MDQDYIKQLSPKEKKFLSDFMEEYYGANLDYENLENNRFHKTEEEKKACTDRNNARNRDAYSIYKATRRLMFEDVPQEPSGPASNHSPSTGRHDHQVTSGYDIEDAMIDYIDNKDTTEE